MWSVALRSPLNMRRLFTGQIWREQFPPTGDEEVIIVENYVTAFSTFKTIERSTAGTTTVVAPNAGGSVSITDIILNSDGATNAVIELRFTDGTNNETLIKQAIGNQTFSLNHTVKGRFQGWKDAQVDFILSGANAACYVTLVYMQLPKSTLNYTSWDALR